MKATTKQCFRKTGVLIESSAFYENLSAKDNLQIIADLRGIQSRDSIVRALMHKPINGLDLSSASSR